jgi:hypothetical protein
MRLKPFEGVVDSLHIVRDEVDALFQGIVAAVDALFQ